MGIDAKTGAVGCGVAVVVTHAGKVLAGRRPRGPGAGLWQLPGGWIEAGESPPQAARREVREETGLELGELGFVAVTSNVFAADFHSITLYFEAECADVAALAHGAGVAPVWRWRAWPEFDADLFLPLDRLRRSGYRPFSAGESRVFLGL